MRAVDPNVLVRLIAYDDPKQVMSAEAFVQGGAWVSLIVLAEATWVLSSTYDRTPEQISTAVEMLLGHQHLVVQDPDTVAAAVDIFKKKPALGFSDCLIVEVARKAGHQPLGTFDRDLAKIDRIERL